MKRKSMVIWVSIFLFLFAAQSFAEAVKVCTMDIPTCPNGGKFIRRDPDNHCEPICEKVPFDPKNQVSYKGQNLENILPPAPAEIRTIPDMKKESETISSSSKADLKSLENSRMRMQGVGSAKIGDPEPNTSRDDRESS